MNYLIPATLSLCLTAFTPQKMEAPLYQKLVKTNLILRQIRETKGKNPEIAEKLNEASYLELDRSEFPDDTPHQGRKSRKRLTFLPEFWATRLLDSVENHPVIGRSL